MVRCDMEGASGIVSYDQVVPGKQEYEYGQKMFMADLTALISGLNAGGADEIFIYDEHYYGRNVRLAELEENVSVYCGKPPYLANWAGGLDESFTGLILLGLHSKSGTPNGTLQHTYEHDIKNIVLNGVSVGEIGMEAAIAGDYKVPLLMITGDSAAIDEGKKLFPGVAGVAVKHSLCEWGALCLPLNRSTKAIFETAKEIAQNQPDVKPYSLGRQIEMDIELHDGAYRDVYLLLFKHQFIDLHTIRLQGITVTEVWAEYWQCKLACLKRLEG